MCIDSIILCTMVRICKNYALKFTYSSPSLMLVTVFECLVSATMIQNSIEWFCLLDEILQVSVMLSLSGTVVEQYHIYGTGYQ